MPMVNIASGVFRFAMCWIPVRNKAGILRPVRKNASPIRHAIINGAVKSLFADGMYFFQAPFSFSADGLMVNKATP